MEEFKWCIKLDSQEAVDYANGHGTHNPYRMSQKYAHFPAYCSILMVFKTVQEGYKELTLTQFKSQILNQRETLPEFWVVFNNGQPVFQKVIGYLFEKFGKRWGIAEGFFYGFDGNEFFGGTNTYVDIKGFENNPVVLSLKQFINLTEMKREIEGYKLVKPEYREAAMIICDVQSFINTNGCDFSINSHSHNRIKEAGVLDLWCTPVYKQESKVYTMGEPGNTFEVVVKDGKAFIGEADITESVKAIQTRVVLPYQIRISDKYLVLHDAILSIPGPETESQKAPFSQWLAIKL